MWGRHLLGLVPAAWNNASVLGITAGQQPGLVSLPCPQNILPHIWRSGTHCLLPVPAPHPCGSWLARRWLKLEL